MKRIISILLVEDDIIDQMEIRRTLDKRGILYYMHVLRNGEDALALMENGKQKPDIILVSIELPRMNGFEFATRIKANPTWAATRIFILSQDAFDEDIKLASKIGISGIIPKPLRLESSASKGAFNLMIDLMNV